MKQIKHFILKYWMIIISIIFIIFCINAVLYILALKEKNLISKQVQNLAYIEFENFKTQQTGRFLTPLPDNFYVFNTDILSFLRLIAPDIENLGIIHKFKLNKQIHYIEILHPDYIFISIPNEDFTEYYQIYYEPNNYYIRCYKNQILRFESRLPELSKSNYLTVWISSNIVLSITYLAHIKDLRLKVWRVDPYLIFIDIFPKQFLNVRKDYIFNYYLDKEP